MQNIWCCWLGLSKGNSNSISISSVESASYLSEDEKTRKNNKQKINNCKKTSENVFFFFFFLLVFLCFLYICVFLFSLFRYIYSFCYNNNYLENNCFPDRKKFLLVHSLYAKRILNSSFPPSDLLSAAGFESSRCSP